MKEFWKLLKESVITQALITILIVGAIVYLSVTLQPIPDILEKLSLLIIGFYFGAKSTAAAQAAVKDVVATLKSGDEKT